MAKASIHTSLPMDIWLLIFEILVQQKTGLASVASVCRAWSEAAEKHNFRRLKLRLKDLDNLERMVGERKRLVRHIWLNIELPVYSCRDCRVRESTTWNHANSLIVRHAISKLFCTLSTWEVTSKGLSLELSAHSPSDREHWFKHYHFGIDDEAKTALEPGFRLPRRRVGRHDEKHGWVCGRQDTIPDPYYLHRIHDWIWLKFPEGLPEVQAVTKFVVRRQCRRRFFHRHIGHLLDKLPRIECLIYEPWQSLSKRHQDYFDIGKTSTSALCRVIQSQTRTLMSAPQNYRR
jgi:hypothetical protein